MGLVSRIEKYMLKLINADRAEADLQPLAFDPDLNEAAEKHSKWMLKTDTFSHQGRNASDPRKRMDLAGYGDSDSFLWGENIAWSSLKGKFRL